MGQVLGKFRTKHKSSCTQKKASEKFKVRICDDVLIDILSFGRRRYFAMLEPHGTRFQYFIERYWPEAPLLILDMSCWKYEKDDDKIYGVSIRRPLQPLFDHDLPLDHVFSSVPRFLRFGNVNISLSHSISMAARCEIYMPLLQQLAPAFRGCSLRFYSDISEPMREPIGSSFLNHRSQLEYIRDRLIPQLFDHCSSYSFGTESLCTRYDQNAHMVDGFPDIAGLLAIDAIKRCNRVDMKHPICLLPLLPINEISTWLHESSKKREERFLSIYMRLMKNIHEMIELLKMQLQEATMPTGHAFTLKLITYTYALEIVEETFKNPRTNEEISISWKFDDDYDYWDWDEDKQIVTIKQAPCMQEPPKKKCKLSK